MKTETKQITIPAMEVNETVIHALLSDNNTIAITFSGKNYKNRMLEITKLYLAMQQAYKELDTVTRKTYHLKASTASSFETYSKEHGQEIGKLITKLMMEFIHSSDSENPPLYAFPKDNDESYIKKSFRIPDSVALMFQEACKKQQVPAGPMLQVLMEFHMTKKESD